MNRTTLNEKLTYATIFIFAALGAFYAANYGTIDFSTDSSPNLAGIDKFQSGGKMALSPTSKIGDQVANSYIKPGAPVRLLSPGSYALSQGDSLSVDLRLSTTTQGTTEVTLNADRELLVDGELTLVSSGTNELVIPLSVKAIDAKIAFINISVAHTDGTGQVTLRALALAFDSRTNEQVAQLKSQAPKEFVEMQAQETIR